LRDQERAPRKYELMTILHPDVPEESLPVEIDRITGYIDAVGGSIIETLRDSPWGRRRLAYPIRSGSRDVRDGYYTVWHFNLGPSRINDLERELKLNTQVIRYIVVSWEPAPIDPKAVEAAEIAAEDAAAAAYAAAQAAAAAAEDAAAEAYAEAAASEAKEAAEAAEAAAEATADVAIVPADETTAIEPVAAEVDAIEPVSAEEAREELLKNAEAAVETSMRLAATDSRAEALTAEAEAVEATGAELEIEPVAATEERETLEAEAAAALAKAEAAATETTAPAATAGAEADETQGEVPADAVRGDGTGECPEEYPVKGNASSMLYHSPGSPSYKRTVPEFCFTSAEAAEAAGFHPTKFEAAQEGE
jgi:ribosomal protein S6